MRAKSTLSNLAILVLIFLGLPGSFFPAEVEYKVILKNGGVVQAASRPVSMEGFVRFKGVDGKFQSLPAAQVDLAATQAASQAASMARPAKTVITNEELGSGGGGYEPAAEQSPLPASMRDPAPRATGPARALQQAERQLNQPGQKEAYLRGKAQQIRSEMASVEARIKQINDNVANKKVDGIQHQTGTYTSYIITGDYREELRQLDLKKQKLEKEMSQLEDEARAAGIPPGVLR